MQIRSQDARNILKGLYEEWRNDFLTYDRFAEYNGITPKQAQALIHIAREVYNSKHPEE